jgi:hypothetical protein
VCHNRVTAPSWNTGTAACTLCHPSYPQMRADGGIGREAHATHTSVKGYGCVQCHPVPGGTSFNHQNGRVKFSLNVTGTYQNGKGYFATVMHPAALNSISNLNFRDATWATCSDVYCHGRVATRNWNLVINSNECTQCHTAGSAVNGPTTGLHRVINNTAEVKAHNEALFVNTIGGAGNGCVNCHTTQPNVTANNHVNNVFSTRYISQASGPKVAASVVPTAGAITTCAPATGRYLNCHTDKGKWVRQWSTNADQLSTVFGSRCSVCHGDGFSDDGVTKNGSDWRTGVVNHVTATGDANTNVFLGKHDFGSACGKCHGFKSGSNYTWAANHGNGRIEMNGPSPSTGAGYNSGIGGCDSAGCHTNSYRVTATSTVPFAIAFQDWGAGVCGSCHGTTGRGNSYGDPTTNPNGAPPNDASGHATGYTVGNHLKHISVSYQLTGHSCNLCHPRDLGGGNLSATHDSNGVNVSFASTAGASAVWTNGLPGHCDSLSGTLCHGSATWNSKVSCAACHATITAHTRQSKTGTTKNCTACHPGTQANAGATAGSAVPANANSVSHGKNGSANVVFIPNATTVAASIGPHMGANFPGKFSSYNGKHGVFLGGYATVGTTEADMCWNCHALAANKVSEWGTNTQQQAAFKTFNYGKVISGGADTMQSRWVRATAGGAQGLTWLSAYTTTGKAVATSLFSYKTGRIRSTHSANAGSGVSGLDNPRWIRCTYCHDVHNTQGPSGGSFLRGRFRANPYPEDGAPRAIVTYTSVSSQGAVPRGNSGKNQIGGWQIDQNNANPTAGSPAITAWAQLCAYCHQQTTTPAPTGNGVWTSAQIKAIDISAGTKSPNSGWKTGLQFIPVTGAPLVAQINGHGAVMLSGGRTSAINIYSESMRNRRGSYGTGATAVKNPGMAYNNNGGTDMYGLRSANAAGFVRAPVISGCRIWAFYNLAATLNTRTLDASYHKFPCSKCHNPHASRLPRLMITNCLDTEHNTWDNVRSGVSSLGTGAFGTYSQNVTHSNGAAAANCHRVPDTGFAKGLAGGWNSVTPWNGNTP